MNKLLIKFCTITFFFIGITVNAQEYVVTQGELPQKAQNFIKQHFPNYIMDYVILEKEILFFNEYKVRFVEGLNIEFDSGGDWEKVDGNYNEIPTSFISKNIVSYVKSKFSNTKIVKVEKGSFGRQEVKLSNGLELEFDSSGNFRRIDD